MKNLSAFIVPGTLLGLLLAGHSAQAQALYNDGGQITLSDGAILYVGSGLTNANGGIISTSGSGNTLRVDSDLINSGTSTLGLGTAGTLEVRGNLLNSATLTPGTSTVLMSGTTGAQTLETNGASLYNLTVNNTAGTVANRKVSLNDNKTQTVTNLLTMTSGMLVTPTTSKVVLPQGATISGETPGVGRFVAGNLEVQRDAVNGSAPVNFGNGATLNPNGSTLGAVKLTRTAGLLLADVSYGVSPLVSSQKSIDQIWRVEPSSASTTPATLTLNWLSDNDNPSGRSFTQSRVWRKQTTGGWMAVGSVQDASSRSISVPVDLAATAARFTVSTLDAPLPVELVLFAAKRQGDVALLTWRTASERNSAYFDVQVSTDGRTFRKLAQVQAQGNTSRPTDYTLNDPALLHYQADPVYYRLRQVDIDGEEAFSPVQAVQIGTGSIGFAASAHPNPADKTGTTLEIRTGEAGLSRFELYDATGRRLLSTKAELRSGVNQVAMPEVANLASGTYFLKVTQGQQHTIVKLVRE